MTDQYEANVMSAIFHQRVHRGESANSHAHCPRKHNNVHVQSTMNNHCDYITRIHYTLSSVYVCGVSAREELLQVIMNTTELQGETTANVRLQ